MTQIRLQGDFNGLFGEYLCLSHGDTCPDESGRHVTLVAGMVVDAYEDDGEEEG